jgi:hypothetical protein
MTTLLRRVRRLVDADPNPRSFRELRLQLRSSVRDTRLTALVRVRKQIEITGLRDNYLTLVEPLAVDPDSTCRWQATAIVGEFIKTEPDRVWQVARVLGKSRNADIRMASSTLLPEHLLQHHTISMTKLVRSELELGDPRFAAAVASCWNFGNGRKKRQIQEVIDQADRMRPVRPWSSRPRHRA